MTVLLNPAVERRLKLRTDRIALFERMVEIRSVEDRVKQLFAEGLVHGTTHTCQGQEAVAVGIASVTDPGDYVACTYRGHGVALALGVELTKVLGEIMGRSTGSVGGTGGSMHLADAEVGLLPTMAIVGAGLPIAVGAALSARTLGKGAVAVSVFGDGATNIGAFHESLNLASVWKLPVVFVCENNLYGEYTRIDRTTAVGDIVDRASAYGLAGHVVDGQDVDAVATAMTEAVATARSGNGPTFLEMKTYRYSGHSRADPASYRPEGELDEWLQRDPIEIFAHRLIGEGYDAEKLSEARTGIENAVDEAIQVTLAAPLPEVSAMFANTYATTVSRTDVQR